MSESIWDDPRITAYVLGEMSTQERADFEVQVSSNHELAAAVEEARAVTGQLASLFGAESIPSLDRDRRAAIVSGGSPMPAQQPARSFPRIGWLVAVAASLLLLAGVTTVMQPQQAARDTTVAMNVPESAQSLQSTNTEMTSSPALAPEYAATPAEQENRRRSIAMSQTNEGLEATRQQLQRLSKVDYDISSDSVRLNAGLTTPAPAPASAPAERFGEGTGGPVTRFDSLWLEERVAAGIPTLDTPLLTESIVLSREPRKGTAVELADKELEAKFEAPRVGADFGLAIDEGRGPGIAGDRFEPITDNPFQRVSDQPLSTFSVDVDTASYSKVRDYLMRANQLPRPDAVRIEELINYFTYQYEPPADSDEHPFAARVSVTSCPWNDEHRLARIALQGKTMNAEERPPCNLVFLLDTSGSMNAANKLPLVIEGMQMLLKQLNDDDQVAITVYAGSAGLVVDSTPVKRENKIRKALNELSAGGSTNGGAGIALAYQTARDHFIAEGVNRVILCTDGDFNVGTTGTDELVRMVEQEAKGGIFLSVLGFGMGNHNDAMLEQISGRGNGNYAFIDSREEARKVLVEQTSGTLVTIAKDVKLQVEFNPTQVSSYRLIGYENRVLAKEDFNDDMKDAGEVGAGHSVTALYEIVPAGVEVETIAPKVDELKYQQAVQPSRAADSEELLTLKLRYKQPDGDISTLVEFPVVDDGASFADADDNVQFVAAVASFGMQLRHSPYAGSWNLSDAMNVANRAKGGDRDGLRAEFVSLVQKASELRGEE